MNTLSQRLQSSTQSGYLLVLVLVYGTMFFALIVLLVTNIVQQSRDVREQIVGENAAAIAEAGLNYYKWYLVHFPDDITLGATTSGPYIFPYEDSASNVIGEYELDISAQTYCGSVSSIEVQSTGRSSVDPSIERTFAVQYSQPTVAEYAFILNANVWAGADRIISGPYHSNGGIRMDATHNSVVTSGQEDWTCTSSFGCASNTTVDGVYGTSGNENPALFSFPSAPVNFAGLTVDLSGIKDNAQNDGGLYFGPSGAYGYRLQMNSNDTVTVHRVTGTYEYWGYTTADNWQRERHVITNLSYVGNYPIPADCPVVFVEDQVWLEGAVTQKVTLAAADLTSPGISPSIILQDDITYTTATSSGLLAIAEEDVLVGLNVPNNMELNGIFIAQNGRYGRNHYRTIYLPYWLDAYVIRNSISLNGTIVSNGRVGTQWSSGGVTTSGFQNRSNSYDRDLIFDPPAATPRTSDVYQFIDWREIR